MNVNPHPGKLIVFEGLDGSGQTTQAKLLAKWLSDNAQIAYYTKEPSDGPAGCSIKLMLAGRLVFTNGKPDPTPGKHDELTMALLFAADRADHLRNEIVPKLKRDIHVVADRYYLSSFAYQSVTADYSWIRELNKHSLRPDLTIFLDVAPEVCVERMSRQRWHVELYEHLDMLRKVHANYSSTIEKLRSEEQIEKVDGTLPITEVHARVVELVRPYLAGDSNGKRAIANARPLSESEIASHREG